MAIIEHELVIEGDDDETLPCGVEGCSREATRTCEVCGEAVCARHSKEVLGLRLCFSCEIGMSEGMGAAMRGWS